MSIFLQTWLILKRLARRPCFDGWHPDHDVTMQVYGSSQQIIHLRYDSYTPFGNESNVAVDTGHIIRFHQQARLLKIHNEQDHPLKTVYPIRWWMSEETGMVIFFLRHCTAFFLKNSSPLNCTFTVTFDALLSEVHINGLVQERHNSSELSMELHFFCIIPLINKAMAAVFCHRSGPSWW